MPLIINSTTNLNKLKFTSSGGDRWDQGKSGQPYIVTPIPGVDDTFVQQLDGTPTTKSGVDFLLRGGLLSVDAAINDVSRLTKLLFDTKSPNGFEFIAKQNVLSRNSVKTEGTFGVGYGFGLLNQGAYAAVGTLAQAGLAPIATGATNLFGVNPLTDDSALSINKGIPIRQGSGGLNGYFGVVNAQNLDGSDGGTANRLVRILDGSNTKTQKKTVGGTIDLNPDGDNVNILRYGGGPKSVLGIGKTSIPFADQRTGQLNFKLINKGFYLSFDQFLKQPLNSIEYKPSQGNYSVFKRPSTTDRNFDQNSSIGASSTFAIDTNVYINRFANGVLSGFTGKIDDDVTSPTYGQVTKDTGTVNSQDLIEPNRVNSPNVSVTSNNYVVNKAFLDTEGPSNFSLLNIASPTISEGVYGGLGDAIDISQISKGNLFISGSGVTGTFAGLFNERYAGELIDKTTIKLGIKNYSDQDPGNIFNFRPSVYSIDDPSTDQSELLQTELNKITIDNTAVMAQDQLYTWGDTRLASKVGLFNPLDFRKVTTDGSFIGSTDPNSSMKQIKSSKVLSISPDYVQKNQNIRTNYGDPGQTAGRTIIGENENPKNVLNYGVSASLLIALDKINAMPLYEASSPNYDLAIQDSVNFNIAVINNDNSGATNTYIHFRALLDEFNDNYTAKWDSVQYVGRGEELYNYKGFGREISMGWTVYAQSKAELIPMYKKLNYLASSLAPDYNNAGYMRGNIVRITVGGYLHNQPGIIKSINFGVPQESPWEIAIDENGNEDSSVKQLPHMIKVTGFTFTPIHEFIPSLANSQASTAQSGIDNPIQKYISLANSSGETNYVEDYEKAYQQGSSLI